MPFPPIEGLPNPGIDSMSPVSPALAGRFFNMEPRGLCYSNRQSQNIVDFTNNTYLTACSPCLTEESTSCLLHFKMQGDEAASVRNVANMRENKRWLQGLMSSLKSSILEVAPITSTHNSSFSTNPKSHPITQSQEMQFLQVSSK